MRAQGAGDTHQRSTYDEGLEAEGIDILADGTRRILIVAHRAQSASPGAVI